MTGTKRKSRGDTPEEVYNHRARSKPSAEARVDPTYGQRSAIPGLDDDTVQDEGGLDYDDEEMDALAYLRAVRLVLFPSDQRLLLRQPATLDRC